MADGRRSRAVLASVVSVPVDVWFVLAGVVETYLALMLPPGNPVRILITLPMLLFLPGYALSTVLFPATRRPAETSERRSDDASGSGTFTAPVSTLRPSRDGGTAGLTGVERAAVSFGSSVALTPLFGLLLQVTVGRYRLDSVLTLVTGFVLLVTAAGVVRRRRVPAEDRFELPLGRWSSTFDAAFRESSGVDLALNVALAVALVVSASTMAFAVVAPQDGSHFTEAYLLARQDGGSFAAKNYPIDYRRGESRPLELVLKNREGKPTSYTVVVVLQRLNDRNDVLESVELERFSHRVAAGGTWRHRHRVTPTLVGTRLRLAYLVYRGSPPATLSLDTAYRHVSLRINVTAPSGGASSSTASSSSSTASTSGPTTSPTPSEAGNSTASASLRPKGLVVASDGSSGSSPRPTGGRTRRSK